MKIPHSLWIALALCTLLIAAPPAHAQDQLTGLVFSVNGDLWNYTPQSGIAQMTNWGYNGEPVQSPDGNLIAYLSGAEEVIESDQQYAGAQPSSIWIVDRSTGSFTRIADQSAGLMLRSTPAWSPDSTRLIWSELDADNYQSVARLMVYDLRTNAITALTSSFDMGYQDGGIFMPPVLWGEHGITRINYVGIGGPNPGNIVLDVYNPIDGALTTYTVGSTAAPEQQIMHHIWVQHEGTAQVVMVNRVGTWTMLDVRTGAYHQLPAPPSLHITSGIDNMQFTPIFVLEDQRAAFDWQATLTFDGGTPPNITSIGFRGFRLEPWLLPAPSGAYSVAWADIFDGDINIWSNAEPNTPRNLFQRDNSRGGSMGVAWLPTQWRTAGPALIPLAPLTSNAQTPAVIIPTTRPAVLLPGCAMPARLTAGQTAQVTPGTPNNVRSLPTVGADRVGQLPGGTRLTVLDGPQCVDGFVWWFVESAEITGWTAEGSDGSYWLEPAP